MKDDTEFEALVRSGLEEGLGLSADVLSEIESVARAAAPVRRSAWLWRSSGLLAASLLAIAGGWAWSAASRSRCAEADVSLAVCLLMEADEIESDIASTSTAELLLAWQDAPYMAIAESVLLD